MAIFEQDFPISFGDCDPAGIVFYPNYFRWMDATYHAFLHAKVGGHVKVCKSLGARGTGLMETKLSFRSPATEGMTIRYAIEEIDWSGRSFQVRYAARAGDRLLLDGYETRGIFIERDGRLTAGDTAPLRDLLA